MKELFTSPRLLLALDFDGTLAPLRRDPSMARVSERRRHLLARLASSPGARLLVVSGRPEGFLRRALKGVPAAFAPEHGWALKGIGDRWAHPEARRLREDARRLAAAARRAFRERAGVQVEGKGFAVAVHYRNAPGFRRRPLLLRDALAALRPDGWRLAPGKCVWEYRPARAWGKGHAVLLAARRLGARVLAAGDDHTDEEAFRRLGTRAWTVKVGEGPTAARRRVAGIGQLDRLLRTLLRRRLRLDAREAAPSPGRR